MGYKSLGRKPHEDVYGSWEKLGRFPDEGDVDEGVTYGPDGTTRTGTLVQPDPADVMSGIQYGAGGTEFTGTATGGGAGFTDDFSLKLQYAETANVVPTDVDTYLINLLQQDTNADLVEAVKLGLSGSAFADESDVPSDNKGFAIRVWAVGCTDNDSSQTVPTNANGQNNATIAPVKTNNALADLTNPVELSTAVYAGVPSGSYSTTQLRVFFSIPARVAFLDTIIMEYETSGNPPITFYDHGATTALVDHSVAGFTFNLGGMGVGQMQTLFVRVRYTAAVVALPETVVNLDAVCIELLTT